MAEDFNVDKQIESLTGQMQDLLASFQEPAEGAPGALQKPKIGPTDESSRIMKEMQNLMNEPLPEAPKQGVPEKPKEFFRGGNTVASALMGAARSGVAEGTLRLPENIAGKIGEAVGVPELKKPFTAAREFMEPEPEQKQAMEEVG